jgi:hypothetical protein
MPDARAINCVGDGSVLPVILRLPPLGGDGWGGGMPHAKAQSRKDGSITRRLRDA